MKSVNFIGLGYIGLPTAVVMANHGVNVTGIDVKQDVIDKINQGEITIVEPGLEQALQSALESGNFRATSKIARTDAFIIAVPTPFSDGYEVDMRFIYSAAESIAPVLTGDELIILESTSPPLTTHRMANRILELRPDLIADGQENPDNKPVLYFAHCPERILPGKAMQELITNDRIIGGETPEATRRAVEIYKTFCVGELLETDAKTAEMAKLTENSFRDVNIAFANELSLIADKLDINVWELIDLANHHPRVNILQPGPGVGGHCIAVDPWFIVSAAPEESTLIHTARNVNDQKPIWVIKQVTNALKNFSDTATLACLGLSFKADIDDLRESPALDITRKLALSLPNVEILAVEPHVDTLPNVLQAFDNVSLTNFESAALKADVILLLVDHSEFKTINKNSLNGKTVIDTRGAWRK